MRALVWLVFVVPMALVRLTATERVSPSSLTVVTT